jgi:hypothetical protein
MPARQRGRHVVMEKRTRDFIAEQTHDAKPTTSSRAASTRARGDDPRCSPTRRSSSVSRRSTCC